MLPIPWERPTDPPGIPAKPQKRLCSPLKQKRDWGFLVLIPRHCEIHRFERRPRSAGSWELATGIVYKLGAKYAQLHNQTQKSQNTMSSLQIPPYSKKARQWKVGEELCREDPFFVRWQNGGLLWDGMVIAIVTCYKEGRSGEDKGGSRLCIRPWPLGPSWWLPLLVWDLAPLGWTTNPPSGRKVVLDS